MPTPTTRLALDKGVGSDNARDYLKTNLAAALDTIDKQGGHPGWKGADIASAAALALGADANYFHVTGVTTITSISSRNAGEIIILEFDGAVTLTHNAVSLILLSGANTTTQAGDVFVFVSEGGGNWREVRPRSSTLVHGAAGHTGDVIPAANQDFGAFFSDIAQIAAPANPAAGTRRIFVDSADAKLKVRTSGGASTSLEEQAALPTSATADVTTSETTTSTTYTDLTTSGPAITLSPGASRKHLLFLSAFDIPSSVTAINTGFASVAIAGAAAVDADAVRSVNTTSSSYRFHLGRPVLTAAVASGSTHTMKYRVSGDTWAFEFRRIVGTTQE